MEGCTFKPAPRRSQARANSSSMADRARQMEIKKQERMAKIRQELFDKEMAQCSFQPQIVSVSSGARERGSDPSWRRLCASGGDRPSLASRPSGIPQSSQYRVGTSNWRAGSAPRQYGRGNGGAMGDASSEESEYWDGNDAPRDEEVSVGSSLHEDVHSEAIDVTILPTGSTKSIARPPRVPSNSTAANSTTEDDSERLKVFQRLQQRRQLLEETLSPDQAPPAPFNFNGANNLSAAIRQRSASLCGQQSHQDFGSRRSSAPAAAVAEAVERMEGLLLGNYSDLSDLEDDGDLNEELNFDEETEDGELDCLGISAEAPVLGGKLPKANPRLSPTRGGC